MTVRFLVFLFFMMWSAPAFSQSGYITSQTPDEVHITLQNRSFATVYELRTLELERGLNYVVLTGLPPANNRQDIQVLGDLRLHGSRVVLEQRGIERVLQTLIGKEITLLGSRNEISGKVEDYTMGMLSLRDSGGRQHIIPNPGDYQIVASSDAVDLREQAGVLLVLDAPETRSYQAEFYYTTLNMGWVAEHQLLIRESDGKLNWRTLAHSLNNTGISMEPVYLSWFSGNISSAVVGPGALQVGSRPRYQRAVPEFEYSTGEAQTFPDSERIQTLLFEAREVPFEKEYHFTLSPGSYADQQQKARVHYVVKTGSDAPMNEKLPAGSVRLLHSDTDEPVLIGDTEISEPVEPGTTLSLSGSKASEVTMDHTMTLTRHDNEMTAEAELEVRNNTSEPTLIRIFQRANEGHAITTSSHVPYERTRNHIEFRFTLQPGETENLYYELSQTHSRR